MDKQTHREPGANAEGEHAHTPESGPHADRAHQPGAHSGSGDVEHAQRHAALGTDAGDHPPVDQLEEPMASNTRVGIDRETGTGRRAPRDRGGDPAKEQAQRILRHNRELMEGDEPTDETEAAAGGVRTSGSGGQQSGAARGDYSND
jgi:hypothetical protein